jgi:hypothetical protein
MSNATGFFEIVEYRDDMDDVEITRKMAKTTVRWSRSFGRCNRRDYAKGGEIYTRAKFRAWLKKYEPYTDLSVADQLPIKVWWQ